MFWGLCLTVTACLVVHVGGALLLRAQACPQWACPVLICLCLHWLVSLALLCYAVLTHNALVWLLCLGITTVGMDTLFAVQEPTLWPLLIVQPVQQLEPAAGPLHIAFLALWLVGVGGTGVVRAWQPPHATPPPWGLLPLLLHRGLPIALFAAQCSWWHRRPASSVPDPPRPAYYCPELLPTSDSHLRLMAGGASQLSLAEDRPPVSPKGSPSAPMLPGAVPLPPGPPVPLPPGAPPSPPRGADIKPPSLPPPPPLGEPASSHIPTLPRDSVTVPPCVPLQGWREGTTVMTLASPSPGPSAHVQTPMPEPMMELKTPDRREAKQYTIFPTMVAHGGFAEVYRAMSLDDGQLIAIKKLALGFTASQAEALANEVQILQGLHHPNIVRCLHLRL